MIKKLRYIPSVLIAVISFILIDMIGHSNKLSHYETVSMYIGAMILFLLSMVLFDLTSIHNTLEEMNDNKKEE